MASITRDEWLSRQFKDVNVYRLNYEIPDSPIEIEKAWDQKGLTQLGAPWDWFCYAKVNTRRTDLVKSLAYYGFSVVDTQLTFEKRVTIPSYPTIKVRPAITADEPALRMIARNCFLYSRFHLDPKIHRSRADEIKVQWVLNCLAGNRGDALMVAETDRVVGFISVSAAPLCQTIDLIGVDPVKQRQKIGTGLMLWLFQRYAGRRIQVGTQAANIPSVRFYESLGFQLVSSTYVLHAHGTKVLSKAPLERVPEHS
jgi:dTDP-4-amino-4,6-dideoxy-D-galactose acyltransferase